MQELAIEEMARTNATHRVIIKAEDLNGVGTGFGALSAASAAATTGTLTPFGALAASVQTTFVAGYLKTPFTAGSITALTLTLGYDLATGTDKAAGYLAATSLLTGATPVSYFPVEIADPSDATTTQAAAVTLVKRVSKAFAAAQTLQALFTSTTANLTDLLTGEVHLYFRNLDLSNI